MSLEQQALIDKYSAKATSLDVQLLLEVLDKKILRLMQHLQTSTTRDEPAVHMLQAMLNLKNYCTDLMAFGGSAFSEDLVTFMDVIHNFENTYLTQSL